MSIVPNTITKYFRETIDILPVSVDQTEAVCEAVSKLTFYIQAQLLNWCVCVYLIYCVYLYLGMRSAHV